MDRRRFMATAGAAMLAPRGAGAQGYPARPIRLIVTFAAGGPADLFARTLASGMSARLGQQVVIDNRPGGAAGLPAIDAIAKAGPDGYQLALAGAAALSTVPFMVAKMPFDWETGLTPLTLVSRVPEVITTNARLGLKSLADLVAYAKRNPGKLNFGSAGLGSITHLASELFKAEAGIDITHVPYRGAAPAVNDLLGQQVQMVFLDLPVLLPQIEAGKLKPIAIGSPKRVAALKDVPTTAEVGLAEVRAENWYGMVAPAKTPPAVIAILNKAAVEAMKDPGVASKLAAQGATLVGDTPEQFRAFIDSEIKKWAKVIKDAGVKTDK